MFFKKIIGRLPKTSKILFKRPTDVENYDLHNKSGIVNFFIKVLAVLLYIILIKYTKVCVQTNLVFQLKLEQQNFFLLQNIPFS